MMIRNVLSSYWQVLKGQRLNAALVTVVMALSGLMEGIALVCLMPLLNSRISSASGPSFVELFGFAWDPFNKHRSIVVALGLFTFLGLLSSLTRLVSDIQILRIRARIEFTFREKLERALLSMQWSQFISLKLGEISKTISQDGYTIAVGAQSIIQCFGAGLVCLFLMILAFGLSPKMALITLLFGLFAFLMSKQVSSLSKKYAPALAESSSALANATEQFFSNLKFIKSFGLVSFAENMLSDEQKKCAKNFIHTYSVNPLIRTVFETCGIVFIVLIIAFAYWGMPSVFGRLIIFLAVFYRIAPRWASMHEGFHRALTYLPYFASWQKRYEFAIQQAERTHIERPASIGKFSTLSFENVHFRYADAPTLNDISFELTPGKILAIVGESGGGKTTILDLATGLIEPTEGVCRLNGVPLQNVSLDSWRSEIGLVMQNSPIFQTTVLGNIVMADPNPDIERAKTCAQMAHAWEFIDRLPNKLDTKLGQKGSNLSQGECQRLSLARALYKNPSVLILDEATNALDAQSESYILQTLKETKGRFAILMVSHRLNNVELADEILVIGKGRILERGTYRELMERTSGDFMRLAKLQGIVH